jgi:prepilin-type N-terminal cleavage/methylation domain-containing protein
MSLRKQQAGFSIVELVLVIVVVAALGLVGYVVNKNRSTYTAAPASSTPAAASASVSSAPQVTTTSDLYKASATLYQNDPGTANSSDSSQLDSQTSAF